MSVKGEKYKSKSTKMKHEKSEGSKERKMEYGSKKAMTHHGVKKQTHSTNMGKSKLTGKAVTAKSVKGFGPRMKKGM